MSLDDVTWRDGERTILVRSDAVEVAAHSLAGHGWDRYELFSTQRSLAHVPAALREAAERVHEVRPGAVNEISAELIGEVASTRLLAVGGGRVIDTAKAVAAVKGGQVAAIPTTLSGAEMTAIHKLPDGLEAKRPARPVLVFAQPELMTSQPERERRASAMNALAHAADSLYTPLAHPVSRMAALEGARRIAAGLEGDDRGELAIGSLLAGYAIDSALFSLHHVICQSLVRVLRTPHAETNAAILPIAIEALLPRAPAEMGELASALGTTREGLKERIEVLAGGRRTLGEVDADRDKFDDALDVIEMRPELRMTPDYPDRTELRRIIESAW